MTFDVDLGLLFAVLRFKDIVNFWRIQHRRVKNRVIADQTFFRQLIGIIGRFNQQHKQRRRGFQPPAGRAWDHDIIAIAQAQVAIITEEFSATFVDKQQLVAIGVADKEIHRLFKPPGAHFTMRIVQQIRYLPRRIGFVFANVIEIK